MKKVMALVFLDPENVGDVFLQYNRIKNHCECNGDYLYSVYELPVRITYNILELEQIYNSIITDEIQLIAVSDMKYIKGDAAIYLAPLLTLSTNKGIGIESVEDGNLDLIDWTSDLKTEDIARVGHILSYQNLNNRTYLIIISDAPKSPVEKDILSEGIHRILDVLKSDNSIPFEGILLMRSNFDVNIIKEISERINSSQCDCCCVAQIKTLALSQDKSEPLSIHINKIVRYDIKQNNYFDVCIGVIKVALGLN